MDAAALLGALLHRRRIDEPVALVVAHPDDETLGAGASLHLFGNLLLVHVTDGAPRDLADAAAYGFADAASYAAARRAELATALKAGDAAPRLAELGAADQQASLAMPALAQALATRLRAHGARAVITQPYEGGHPDHDASCLIAHEAAREMPGIAVLEMTSYHAGADGGRESGCFLPNGDTGIVVPLGAGEQERKRAMLDCFETQRGTLAQFGTEQEAFRIAPRYDFTASPHAGTLHYERYDWGMTGVRWRALAREARARGAGAC